MATIRTRREPPPFRAVDVAAVEARSPYLTRVTLTGAALEGFEPGLPAASLRLLLPGESGDLVIPIWQGNEFLLDDGSRAIIRTLTPLRFDLDRFELDVEIVRHGNGPLSRWADVVSPGDRAAVSGTGRGYEVDPAARSFVLMGDESALPAIGMLVSALPPAADVQVIVEIRNDEARLELPARPGMTVEWLLADEGSRPGDALVAAVAAVRLEPDVRVWAAGEAAAVHRIRGHLFDERGVPRAHAVVRGYWKVDRGIRSTAE